MTAEISILNRTAIVLATDSAVTIGRGEAAKTYLTENKLFELSKSKPVGLMVYNVLEYFGLPLEVVIKDFRDAHGDSKCGKVSDWQSTFVDYLAKTVPPDAARQDKQFFIRINELVSEIAREFLDGLRKLRPPRNRANRRQMLVFGQQAAQLLNDKIDARIADAQTADPCAAFGNGDGLRAYIAQHDAELIKIEDRNLPAITQQERDKLRQLYFDNLYRKIPSDHCTGLVFAGFGDDQQYPALHHIILDGFFAGVLRSFDVDEYVVDNAQNIGTVLAFA